MKQKEISKEKRDRMFRILDDLKEKMGEIEELRQELERERKKPITPEQSRIMLEEIKVPPLELITEDKKRKR